MMLSLSASQPTVSATLHLFTARCPRHAHDFRIDPLDEVVALLVELVHAALGRGDLVIVVDPRLVLLVPELDVGLREARDQGADRLFHRRLLVMKRQASPHGGNARKASQPFAS